MMFVPSKYQNHSNHDKTETGTAGKSPPQSAPPKTPKSKSKGSPQVPHAGPSNDCRLQVWMNGEIAHARHARNVVGPLSKKSFAHPDERSGFASLKPFFFDHEALRKENPSYLDLERHKGRQVRIGKHLGEDALNLDAPDARSWKLKISLLLASENTTTEHEWWTVLRLAAKEHPEIYCGVGVHVSNYVVSNASSVITSADHDEYQTQLVSAAKAAFDTGVHARPQYVVVGTGMDHVFSDLRRTQETAVAFDEHARVKVELVLSEVGGGHTRADPVIKLDPVPVPSHKAFLKLPGAGAQSPPAQLPPAGPGQLPPIPGGGPIPMITGGEVGAQRSMETEPEGEKSGEDQHDKDAGKNIVYEKLGVSHWHEAVFSALQKCGAKRIAVLSTFDLEGGHLNTVRLFEQMGFEVVRSVGLGCATEVDAAHVRDSVKKAAIIHCLWKRGAGGVDAIVQCGTNMGMLEVIEEVEKEIPVPVLGANQVLLWHALRENSLDAPFPKAGKMFYEHMSGIAMGQKFFFHHSRQLGQPITP